MTDKAELIDAVHDMRAAAMRASNRVEDVAAILNEVGMTRLVDRLLSAVAPLNECSKRMVDAYGEKLHEDLNYSQAMAGNMVLLALKVASGMEEATS